MMIIGLMMMIMMRVMIMMIIIIFSSMIMPHSRIKYALQAEKGAPASQALTKDQF